MRLEMRPGRVVQWEEFVTEPVGSIALDGYCAGPPRYDAEKRIVNFNHHEGVDRLGTRSTTGQVEIAIQMGFRPDGPVFLNDRDEDVCGAVFLLRHPEWVGRRSAEFFRSVDWADTTAGLWGADDPGPILWVFEPYRVSRQRGDAEASEYVRVIDEVGDRILAHLEGRGGRVNPGPLSYYKVLDRRDSIGLVCELGPLSRPRIYRETGWVGWVAVRPGPLHPTYTIIKPSQFAGPRLDRVQRDLNRMEELSGSDARWGGADSAGCTVMGSDRSVGSGLDPTLILDCVERNL